MEILVFGVLTEIMERKDLEFEVGCCQERPIGRRNKMRKSNCICDLPYLMNLSSDNQINNRLG